MHSKPSRSQGSHLGRTPLHYEGKLYRFSTIHGIENGPRRGPERGPSREICVSGMRNKPSQLGGVLGLELGPDLPRSRHWKCG